MFNFFLISVIAYYFYKNAIKTGNLKKLLLNVLPGFVSFLDDFLIRNGFSRNRGRENMTFDEARQVLGLTQTASRDEILSRFKQLMLKYHPDKGGTAYMADKIIQAKKILLKE